MRNPSVPLVILLSLGGIGLLATPVAAQSSVSAELINTLNGKLLLVAVPITLLIQAIYFYAIVKFRNNDSPVPTQENRRLEITWTVATAVILVFVGVASYGVLANENVTYQQPSIEQVGNSGADPVEVHVEAYQWGWEMSYPEAGNFSTGTEIVIPNNRDVVFHITSRDVIHGFHVPKLALKQDALPGEVQSVKTKPLETGTYQGYCSEFCGVSHSQMYFTVEVVSQQEYRDWVESQQESDE
jgi:cytochrome c oxidase subunit 2